MTPSGRARARRWRWHTHICWRGGAGIILVRARPGDDLAGRREVARQLARWAWGALPGERRPAPSSARERGGPAEQFREAG